MEFANHKQSALQSLLQSDHALIEQKIKQARPYPEYAEDEILEFEPDGTRLVSLRVASRLTGWPLHYISCRRDAMREGLFPILAGRKLRYRLPDLACLQLRRQQCQDAH